MSCACSPGGVRPWPLPRRPHTTDRIHARLERSDQTARPFFYRVRSVSLVRELLDNMPRHVWNSFTSCSLLFYLVGRREAAPRTVYWCQFFRMRGHVRNSVREETVDDHASPYAHDEMSDLTTTQSTRPSRLVISEVWAGGASIYGERVHPCTRVLPPHHVCSCLVTSWSLRIDDAPVRACFLNTYTRASCVARPADGRT